MTSEKKSFWAIIAALLLGTGAIFFPVIHFEFLNYDDPAYVSQNAHVQGGLTWAGVCWAFRSGDASNWHPLTWLSHMLDWQLFGNNPGAHHITSLLLHVTSSVLLFLLLRRLTGALWRSAIVAALFAWHPLRVESVAWLAERKDVLSGCFFMLTLLAYVRYAETRKCNASQTAPPTDRYNSPVSWYITTLLCFALGLMAKPMLVTLPFVLLLLDFWPLSRVADREVQLNRSQVVRVIVEKIPFFLLAIGSSIVTFIVQRNAGSVRALEFVPLDYRIINALEGYFRYLAKTFWPDVLSPFYPSHDLFIPFGIAAGIGLLAFTGLFVWQARKRAQLLIGWCWYVGMLVPVIGFVQVGAQSVADRYTYLPTIGILILLVWTVAEALGKLRMGKIAVPLAVVVLLALATRTSLYVPKWHDSISLFQHALRVTQDNYVAHINLASALMSKGQLDEAMQHYASSLETDPTFEGHLGLASILEKQGKLEQAVEHYRAALQIQPRDAMAHNNLSVTYSRVRRLDNAISESRAALELDPNFAEAHYNLANFLVAANRQNEGIAEFQKAIALKPDYPDAHNNLATSLAESGNFAEARVHLEKVVQLKPNDAEAHFNLSYVLSKLGQKDESKKYFQLALKLDPNLLKKRNNH